MNHSQTLMLDRYGMSTWVHSDPWEPDNPELCRPFKASPDFSRGVRFKFYANTWPPAGYWETVTDA